MPRVELTGSLRDALDGTASIDIEADTIRELLRKLVERYPRLGPMVEDGIAVSIDGEIFRDQRETGIPRDAEIFLLPRIPGG